MDTSAKKEWVHLAPNPKSYRRQLHVKGTEILAWDLYVLYVDPDEPMTPVEIAEDQGVPVGAVHEAIAYVESNPPEIRQDFADEEAWFAAREWKDGRLIGPKKP